MQAFLTQETPGKVLSFTGAALFSMALLFSVSASNAGFGGTEYSLPDPFAPAKVVGAIDSAASSYSQALMSFLEPARDAVAVHQEQIQWVVAEASQPLAQFLGLDNTPTSKVAGAFTRGEPEISVGGSYESLSVDDIYSLLIGD